MNKQRGVAIQFILFIVAIALVCIFVLSSSQTQKPNLSEIRIEQADVAKDLKRNFSCVCSDNKENVYLHAISLAEQDSYIIKFNRRGEEIAWFRFPYSSNVEFAVDAQTEEMAFYRPRNGDIYIYDQSGELVETEAHLRDGLKKRFIGLESGGTKLNLISGIQYEIMFHKGLFSLDMTYQDGSVKTVY